MTIGIALLIVSISFLVLCLVAHLRKKIDNVFTPQDMARPRWMESHRDEPRSVTVPRPAGLRLDSFAQRPPYPKVTIPSFISTQDNVVQEPLSVVPDVRQDVDRVTKPKTCDGTLCPINSVQEERLPVRLETLRAQPEYVIPPQVRELHYITPITNLPNILKHGILSYNLAQQYNPDSVAMKNVNARRHHRIVDNGWTVHDHANLYFNARNPMMYKRKASHQSLCVLWIDPEVLQMKWVAISDGNAASDSTQISTDREVALSKLDFGFLYGESWNHVVDGRRRRCAEALILDRVSPDYIRRISVSSYEMLLALDDCSLSLPVTIDEQLFFQ